MPRMRGQEVPETKGGDGQEVPAVGDISCLVMQFERERGWMVDAASRTKHFERPFARGFSVTWYLRAGRIP